MSATSAANSLQELRHLIAQLERSGLAAERPEARALLERSRAMLRAQRSAPRRLGAKLATLLGFAVDAALLAALPVLALLLMADQEAPAWLGLAVFMPGWALFRLRRQLYRLTEAARWLGYHLAWGWDWLAEAFSLRALERLEARLGAREVMSGWRRHRPSLTRKACLDDVAGYLAVDYGPQAALAFRRATAAVDQAQAWTLRGGQRRNHASERLAALRWSALIRVFGQLAASGALGPGFSDHAWPAPLTALPDTPEHDLLPPNSSLPEPEAVETLEQAARRADLRDLIRQKRKDITAAFGWKLKSAGEIAERDVHLAQLRAEIVGLERELARLGG